MTDPDPGIGAVLLYGPDAVLVSEQRRKLTAAVIGEGDDAAMRLDRIPAQDARRDPALVADSLAARGFFPGRRLVLVENATDGMTAGLKTLLAEHEPEDALLVLTADQLPGRSSLRKLFETGRRVAAIALYPEAPGPMDLDDRVRERGAKAGLTSEAAEYFAAIASELETGAITQLVETVGIFADGRAEPVTLEELETLAPALRDAETDMLIAAAAGGFPDRVGPLMHRLIGQGTALSSIAIAASRHFRQMHAVISAPDGMEAGLGRLRPPVFGPRRSAMASQCRRWGPARCEAALRLIHETERVLRSAGQRPDAAILERCLVRLAAIGQAAG